MTFYNEKRDDKGGGGVPKRKLYLGLESRDARFDMWGKKGS